MAGRRGSLRSKKASCSPKDGLGFPVSLIDSDLNAIIPDKQVDASASIYLSAVLEYLSAEILELAGDEARDHERTFINPIHIDRAMKKDEELTHLLGGVMAEYIMEVGELSRHLGELTVVSPRETNNSLLPQESAMYED